MKLLPFCKAIAIPRYCTRALIFCSVVFSLGQNIEVSAQPSLQVHPKIIDGRLITPKNSSIVQVLQQSSKGDFLCTGSVLSTRSILTAWHCVTSNPSDMKVVANGVTYAVQKVSTHPLVRQDAGTGLIHYDVAVLTLSRPIHVPTLSLMTSRPIKSGNSITIVGYGLDEFGNAGSLRTGTTSVDGVTSEYVITVFNGSSESDSCNGDSGGPAILSYTDSKGRVRKGIVGITSAGTSTNCTTGDETFYINTQARSVKSYISKQAPGVTFQ